MTRGFTNPKSLAIVQDALLLAGEQLHVKVHNIDVTFPPPIDDFDAMHAKIFWRAELVNTEGWPNNQMKVGTRLMWPEEPAAGVLSLAVLRSASFSYLTAMLAEGPYIWTAIRSYGFDQDSYLVAAYKMGCFEAMQQSVVWPTMQEIENGKKPSIASLGKIQSLVIDNVKRASLNWLKNMREKMIQDLRRDAE